MLTEIADWNSFTVCEFVDPVLSSSHLDLINDALSAGREYIDALSSPSNADWYHDQLLNRL
jgi:hypothetical protein